MTGIVRLEADPGLLTNRLMSVELGVGIATLTGRRLSMPWHQRIGGAPGPRPASEPDRELPLVSDLWVLPDNIVADDEWHEIERDSHHSKLDLSWCFAECVYLGDSVAVPDPTVREFANGRTTYVRVPPSDVAVVGIAGRPFTGYAYFFHATGPTRRRLLDAIRGVRLRQPYVDLADRIADQLGPVNVAHIRRTDLVAGIPAYADVTPDEIAANLAEILPVDERLVIASEAGPDDDLFGPIRRRFSDVMFLSQIVLRDFADGFGDLPAHEDNALGAVSQEVAARASRFVGTFGSTFTGLIHRRRCVRDPLEPFSFTTDYSPPGPSFRNGRFLEAKPGRYSWNRVGLNCSPDVQGWLREWPESVTSPDEEDAPSDNPVTGRPDRRGGRPIELHSVVCTDMNPYGDWQARFQEHTWRRVRQPGELVRLVACEDGDTPPGHDHARVITTAGRNTHPIAPDQYAGFNRLWSLREWLADEHPTGSVLILDADFAFRSPVTTVTAPGQIVVQEWHGHRTGRSLADRLLEVCDIDPDSLEPFTWPMVIDAGDLADLMPRWLELTALLRRATDMWESDMYALVGAVAEAGLDIRYETLGAWTSWPEDFVAGAPIIHYCQPILDRSGARLWYKQDWRPWAELHRAPGDPRLDTRPYEPLGFDPNDAALDYCRDLLHLLDEWVRLQVDAMALDHHTTG